MAPSLKRDLADGREGKANQPLHESFTNDPGSQPDLDEVASLRMALDRSDDAHRETLLFKLAGTLWAQFRRIGQLSDLDEAISLYRDTVALRPMRHPGRPSALSDLAVALHDRFDHTRQRLNLDEAISMHRAALALRPVPHPDRLSSLDRLASALQTRFRETDQRADIDESVSLHRESLRLRSFPHLNRTSALSNLATALLTRFNSTSQLCDLNEAVSLNRDALSLINENHPDRPSLLNNLATTVYARFHLTHQRQDLDEVISLHQKALVLQSISHPARSDSLINLATVLRTRYDQTRQRSDLDEAIMHCLQALRDLPPDHPKICTASVTLGVLYMDRFDDTIQTGVIVESDVRLEDLTNSMEALRAAARCETARVKERFNAAKLWATLYPIPDGSAMEAYQTAIGLLPRLAATDLDLDSRRRAITSNTDGLAREAAAYAIQCQRFDKAIELLEDGRAIFWSQALQLRTPLDKLHSVEPKLAQDLRTISRSLEQGALRDVSRTLSEPLDTVMSMEQEASHYRQLNEDWLVTVEKVRKIPEFQDFLLPKSYATLSAAAANGPIVILNGDELRSSCDALIVRHSRDPIHVPLQNFTLDIAKQLVGRIRTLSGPLFPLVREDRTMLRKSPGAENPDAVFQDVLATLWKLVVQPILRALNLKRSSSPPRLWWLCTGPFTSLPIHAAGNYDISGGECVGDHAVSSYTPTLSALLTSLPKPAEDFEMLVTIDQVRLQHTTAELHKVQRHVPSKYLVNLGTPDAPANVERVLACLQTASIVHLACYGIQDTENSLDSGLLLKDCRLKVSQLMNLSMPKASLVFLSACQTAMGDESLPDESMHLAATMLFVGFRGAVATMWSIKDSDGPVVADHFYHHLFPLVKTVTEYGPRIPPDTTHAARALHLAVTELRDKLHNERVPSQFARWVPFIHMHSI